MAGLFDGAFGKSGLLPYGIDPFAAAALRTRQSVRPQGGRLEGVATSVLENYLPHVAQGLVTLPRRAFGAADEFRRTGEYDPAAILEPAMMMTGTPGVPRGALGSSAGRPARLPMDEVSRMARADAMGFRREMPIQYGQAPAGEKIAAAAIDVDGRIFAGRNHSEAIQRAEAELGKQFDRMTPGPIEDGFVTTSGRYISRWEAGDIAQRSARGEPTGVFGATHGLAAEGVAMMKPGATSRSAAHTGATAPGLPGGEGVWGYRLPQGASSAEGALWHRAQTPRALDARGLQDWEIQATLKSAWEAGHDAVMLKNYTSPGGKTEDILVVKDPAQLRSPYARFDPEKRNSPNLLATIAGAGAVAAPTFDEILGPPQ